jgi:hypothetical protein
MDFLPPKEFTDHEERLINAAVERALLMLPEAVEHLIMQKAATKGITSQFFKDNKEISAHLDLVQSIIEKTEGENPGIPFSKVLELAEPIIKDKIKKLSAADYKMVERPNTQMAEERKPDFGAL